MCFEKRIQIYFAGGTATIRRQTGRTARPRKALEYELINCAFVLENEGGVGSVGGMFEYEFESQTSLKCAGKQTRSVFPHPANGRTASSPYRARELCGGRPVERAVGVHMDTWQHIPASRATAYRQKFCTPFRIPFHTKVFISDDIQQPAHPI